MAVLISQAAADIGTFTWNEGDPVSLEWRVDTDWSGVYQAQIRKTRKPTGTLVGSFVVDTEYDTVAYPLQTLFTMTITEINSLLIPAGNYFTDLQEIGGVTRVWGRVVVQPHVTVFA